MGVEHLYYATTALQGDAQRVLLVKILNALRGGSGGGGGGTTGLSYLEGAGAPTVPPSNTATHWIYRDTSNGNIFWWDTTSQTWQ